MFASAHIINLFYQQLSSKEGKSAGKIAPERSEGAILPAGQKSRW
jgi:hypothetical protein